jgi:hypothetical protein
MTTNGNFDFETLTLDEVETIELLTNSSIDTILDDVKPKGKALKAIIYVIKKRTDPNFTIEMAGKIPLAEAQNVFMVADDPKE